MKAKRLAIYDDPSFVPMPSDSSIPLTKEQMRALFPGLMRDENGRLKPAGKAFIALLRRLGEEAEAKKAAANMPDEDQQS